MRFSPVSTEFFPLRGGLDLVSQPIALDPGALIASLNYEASYRGGYERVTGYERFDGRPKPSDARFTAITLAAPLDGSVVVGDTINGQTSGATGVVSYISTDRLVFCVTKQVSTFTAGENIRKVLVVVGVYTVGANPQLDINLQFKLAAAQYRADIAAVPGAGPVRGVWRYKNTVYAFRNNVGNTACAMWKSSGTGWQAVTLPEYVTFTAGAGNVAEGQTLTQGGVTATIRRVCVRTGSLGGSNGVGIAVISNRSGGNFAAGAATTSGGGTMTLSGAQTQYALQPGGRFEFVNNNFSGNVNNYRMYGCDGVNPAFEFDGTWFVPIFTGMPTDAPKFITAHRQHLFLAFGASLQHSGTGDQFSWSPVFGAAELALGDTVSGMQVVTGKDGTAALMVFTRNSTLTLYGTSISNWQLITSSRDTGAIPYTVQSIFATMYLDDIGITTTNVSQSFGNFEASSLSDRVRPLLVQQAQRAVASVVVRNKNQYRLFFDDTTGMTVSFIEGKLAGITPFRLLHAVTCISESEEENVSIYFGSSDGFVYQLDRGRSFDGAPIDCFMQLAFSHSKSPRTRKRYRGAVIELSGESSGDLDVQGQFSYGVSGTNPTNLLDLIYGAGGSIWGLSSWGTATWGAVGTFSIPLDVVGTGFNLSMRFSSNSDQELAHTITGVILQYMVGRNERG